ncbi:MAG: hypothetical protein K2X90_04035 [Candidatus Babeliaceae bacterium]|nr:hypothetical protein [Candidatus Babeliaceae bacterium]
MKIKNIIFFILFIQLTMNASRVALCVMATGRYNIFAEQMIESARKYFCSEHNVHYFVFTDGALTPAADVTKIFQKRLGWPYDTLMRFSVYLQHKDLFELFDYIYAIDADMLFVSPVGSEIFSDLVGTQHPGYINRRGTYEETNKKSTAYVHQTEGKHYFAGGFYGGSRENFFKILQTVANNIEFDLKNNFIAVWHDESHLNRYFIDNPPTLILSPAYCSPENINPDYYDPSIIRLKKKIIALDKNHSKLRA